MASQIRAAYAPEPENKGLDYNRMADNYARHRSASPVLVAHIIERLGCGRPGPVLELGCGTGNYLRALASGLGVEGFGLDQSPAMLARHSGGPSQMRLVQADAARSLPFRDAVFDLALSVDVIHYIDIADLAPYFERVKRVLQIGGATLTVTDSEQDIRNRTMSHYFPETLAAELDRYHPIADIQGAMESTGFSTTSVSHVERRIEMDAVMIDRFRNKAFSALRLIPESDSKRGLDRLEQDAHAGPLWGVEVYSCVWGITNAE